MQQWPDDRLEAVHDFIQWMFPLPNPSPVNPTAPILDAETIRKFRAQPALQQNLKTSFNRMLRFFGMEVVAVMEGFECPTPKVARAASFAERARNWLSPGNHNHLRITRIIRCLWILGLEEEAGNFFACLAAIYDEERAKPRPRISPETFLFWRRAASGESD